MDFVAALSEHTVPKPDRLERNLPQAPMPFTFDMLLQTEGISPDDVQLVRHQDHRHGRKKSPYELWRTQPEAFRRYQAIQDRDVFRVSGLLASFVAVPIAPKRTLTLFVGLFRIVAKGAAPDGERDPLGGHDVAGLNLYQLEPDDRLKAYEAKLGIEWGQGLRSWVQRAGRQPKPIVELRSNVVEPEFPGFLRFMEPLSAVSDLPASWLTRLREAKGVYLLTCPNTKEWYVGSATGEGGFVGRWADHAKAGGDAAMLKSREPSDYQIAILEVAGSTASEQDILNAEYLWMEKLQTNKMGLNGGMLRNGREKPSAGDKIVDDQADSADFE